MVRAAGPADVDAICTLLHTKMNSRIPVERWRRLMTYSWLDDRPDFGRVVESQGEILGYCGMVYADRMIGNARDGLRPERMVSMSSWYLDKSLRGKGLGKEMLVSAIEDPNLSYATLTNSKKPIGIVESLGFEVLEDHRYIWQKKGGADRQIRLITDSSLVRPRIEAYQQQLLDDMAGLALAPMLLEFEGQQALQFFSIASKGENVIWYDLMYSSDYALFTRCAQAMANSLLPDSTAKLAADGRFVEKPPAGTVREALPVARYFVSQRVSPQEIDHLYSELQLLDLKLD